MDNPTEFDLLPHARRELEIIRAVRRCPLKATRTVLPSGFRRFDLPPGITEIPFTEPPPPTYEPLWSENDEDEPDEGPEAVWLIAA